MRKEKISLCLWCSFSEETILDRCPNCGKPLLKSCVSCGRELVRVGQRFCSRADCPEKSSHFLDLLFSFKSLTKKPLNRFAIKELERLGVFTEQEINEFKQSIKEAEHLFDSQIYDVRVVSIENDCEEV